MGLIKFLFGKSAKTLIKEAVREVINEEFEDNPETGVTMISFEPEFKIKAILSNTTLTVVLPSGDFIVSYEGSKELLEKVRVCKNEEEVKDLLMPEIKAEQLKKKLEEERIKRQAEINESATQSITSGQQVTINTHYQTLVESGDFEDIDGNMYLKGIKISIPPLMLFKFAELVEKVYNHSEAGDNEIDGSPTYQKFEDEYQALKNFWMWCVLCPSANSRKQLFQFLKNHDLRINKNGFFFAYRRVVTREGKQEDAKLVSYITSEYLRIKVKNKKSPSHYVILKSKDGEYSTVKAKEGQALPISSEFSMVGTVREMYDSVQDLQDQVFTDNATKTFDIRIGQEVSMPREQCDDNPHADCSTGLHIGAKSFGFGGFGDTHILVLVNPMNAVSVPHYATNKMRVSAYLPVAVITNTEEQTTFLEDADVMELGEHYFADQVSLIEERAKAIDAEIPDAKEIIKIREAQVAITEVLEKQVVNVREALKNRVVKI